MTIRIPIREEETVTFGRAAIMSVEITVAYRPGTDPEDIIDAILDVPGVEGTVHKESVPHD